MLVVDGDGSRSGSEYDPWLRFDSSLKTTSKHPSVPNNASSAHQRVDTASPVQEVSSDLAVPPVLETVVGGGVTAVPISKAVPNVEVITEGNGRVVVTTMDTEVQLPII
ncbi:MAG: hypothetical protein Q8835_03010 [Sweet potato little leaf phytoplasma]|nr:hypothetical protein [Sweet potato little leaf phytoplasma]